MKHITYILFYLLILSCSDSSAQKKTTKASICMSNPGAEVFKADKGSYLSERGKSITFTLNIIKHYKELDIPNDARETLRGLISSPNRYKSKIIISNGLNDSSYHDGLKNINGLKHYINTYGLHDISDEEQNEQYRDIFISSTDDYFYISCTRLTQKRVSPSCKVDYRYKNVDVSYYISRLL